MRLKRELVFVAQVSGLLALRNALRNRALRRAPYRLAAFTKCNDNFLSRDPSITCTGNTVTCPICPLRTHQG